MKTEIVKTADGARVLYVLDKNCPSVEISILFKVGSRSDPKNLFGLAHLFEHLNFQGTSKYKSNSELVLAIENLGANSDAFTGYENMGFSLKVPFFKAKEATVILFNMVLESVFNEKDIKKEIKVISEEIKMYDDIPAEKVQDEFQRVMFRNNNLGENIAGTIGSIAKIVKKDLIDFRRDFINKENLLIVVAGNFLKEELHTVIEEAVSKFSKTKAIIPESYTKPILDDSSVLNIKREIMQSNIVLGTYGKPRTNKVDYALKLGNVILSGGMGSLLYQEVREKRGLVYYVSSSHHEFSEIGLFKVEFGVDPSKANAATSFIIGLLNEFVDGQISSNNFERAKNYLTGLYVTQLETSTDIASWNASNMVYNTEAKFEEKEEIIKSIQKLTKNNVIDAWEPVLKNTRYNAVNIGNNDLII